MLDEQTLAFADFSGNRQYISTGNLSENPRAQLFLIDYRHRRRIKIWGEARMVADEHQLQRLMPAGYPARGQQVFMLKVSAWDVNCRQHIPLRYEAEEMEAALQARDARIAQLEQRVRELESSVA